MVFVVPASCRTADRVIGRIRSGPRPLASEGTLGTRPERAAPRSHCDQDHSVMVVTHSRGGVALCLVATDHNGQRHKKHRMPRDKSLTKTSEPLPLLLTVVETAALLRTTRKGVYAMIERGLLPGVTRIGRRVLVRSTDLLDFLDHNRAPSPQEYRR